MKVIIAADIHLSGFESDPLGPLGLPWKLEVIINSFHQMLSLARIRGIRTIILAGDIINDKSIIYTEAQEAFRKILIQYSDLKFILLSGNHDLSKPGQTQVSAISVFETYHNVECIVSPKIVGDITYIPYSHTIYDDIENTGANKILVSHFGLNEATLQSGISVKTEIKLNDLRKFKLVVLGHYHAPQYLSNTDTDLYYTGSFSHRNWNDKNEQKRFLVVDTDSLEVESIDFIGFKEFREYVINNSVEEIEKIQLAENSRNQGHIVRLINNTGEKLQNQISNLAVLEKPKEIDPTNRGLDLTQTKKDRLMKYLEIKEIPENERELYFKTLQTYDVIKED